MTKFGLKKIQIFKKMSAHHVFSLFYPHPIRKIFVSQNQPSVVTFIIRVISIIIKL